MEELINVVHTRQLLIIIDRCRQLIQNSKDEFNMFLKGMVDKTIKIKYIVITQDQDDVTRIRDKIEVQVSDLSP